MDEKRLNELMSKIMSDPNFVVRVNERAMRSNTIRSEKLAVMPTHGVLFKKRITHKPRLSIDDIRRHYATAVSLVNSGSSLSSQKTEVPA